MNNNRPADFPNDQELAAMQPVTTLAALIDAFVGSPEWDEHDVRESMRESARSRKRRTPSCSAQLVPVYRYAQVEQESAAAAERHFHGDSKVAALYAGLSAGYSMALAALRRGGTPRMQHMIEAQYARDDERRKIGLAVDVVYSLGYRTALLDVIEKTTVTA